MNASLAGRVALVAGARGRGIAVQVDHLVPDEVSALVDRIEADHGALHVLVNDIWGATTMEWGKSVWESSLDVGLRTLHLGKAAVGRMALALARDLRPHDATAVSLTPGWLRSEAMLEAFGVSESNWRDATERIPHFAISESPAFVGRAVAALAGDLEVSRWNGASLSSGQLAQVYGFTDLDGSRPDAWRYVPEV